MTKKPLIHYITHPIVMTDCANAILAVGGSPIMAEHHEEIQVITAKSAALVLNLGNITDYRMAAMRLSGHVALEKRLPLVLDLTGLGISPLRKTFAKQLIADFSPNYIKGNVSELLALLDFPANANGVDTGDHHLSVDQLEAFKTYCQVHTCAIMVTGKVDVLIDDQQWLCIQNGSEKLTQVTGTGCMLAGLLGYFAAQTTGLEAAKQAVGLMTVASELADQATSGIGSFKVSLFDYMGQ